MIRLRLDCRDNYIAASRAARAALGFGGLEAMEYACAPLIDRAMDAIDCRGVSLVVRIVPDPKKDIGFTMMSMFHYGKDVNIVTVETVEEAQRALGD